MSDDEKIEAFAKEDFEKSTEDFIGYPTWSELKASTPGTYYGGMYALAMERGLERWYREGLAA